MCSRARQLATRLTGMGKGGKGKGGGMGKGKVRPPDKGAGKKGAGKGTLSKTAGSGNKCFFNCLSALQAATSVASQWGKALGALCHCPGGAFCGPP